MIRRVLMQLAALASALALAYVAWLSGRNLPAAIALVAFLSFAIAIYASADGRKRQRLAEGLADALFEAEDDDDGEGHEPGEALAHLRRFLLGVDRRVCDCLLCVVERFAGAGCRRLRLLHVLCVLDQLAGLCDAAAR